MKKETLISKHKKLYDTVLEANDKLFLSGKDKTLNQKINEEKMLVIAEALKVNVNLKEIYLPENVIGDEGAKHVAELLKVNSSLKTIYLVNNQIGDQGAKYLLDSLYYNNTLTFFPISENKMNFQMESKIKSLIDENKEHPEKARMRIENILKKSKEIKILKISTIELVKKKKKKKFFNFYFFFFQEYKRRKRRISVPIFRENFSELFDQKLHQQIGIQIKIEKQEERVQNK